MGYPSITKIVPVVIHRSTCASAASTTVGPTPVMRDAFDRALAVTLAESQGRR